MNKIDRVIPFDAQQVTALKRDLRISDEDTLSYAIGSISGTYHYYRFVVQAREKSPNVEAVKARANAILKHAEALREAIYSDPLPGLYFKQGNDIALGRHRSLLTYNLGELPEILFDETIDRIVQQATDTLGDERALRANNVLPSRDHYNQTPTSQALWPGLFGIYHELVGTIGYSPSGPLERFLDTVHQAVGLPEVSGPTLKFVFAQWKKDKAPGLEG